MIPALITSTYNRHDLLEAMLQSIDEPVERGLICVNGPEPWHNGPLVLALAGDWRVSRPPFTSLGWPGTLNFGIAQMHDAPWWIFCNDDLRWEPGALAAWAAQMDGYGDAPAVLTARWAAFAMTRAVVERVGLFDEWSFWPLYFDDTDFAYRCALAGVPVYAGAGGVIEGADGHATSLTTASDPALSLANNRTWQLNETAYREKWGGLPGHERYQAPWDMAGAPPSWTPPSLLGRMRRHWP